ncbi:MULTISPECIES: heme biosynthesis protein HemY [unclassified Ensifer]|uniref:heme biosynthesis protein HemY n=1 Tax=unclassified Ensifer TaxID=2633371 RepID=UPI0008132E38|nr:MULTISPECIES: heme biosynthesis protein HemY [unclassified Ensifer]OCP11058.1 heme biosynthesis protein HemY [Ensifer sp. LC14]OCP12770.1 heme biosynthesis protein HemY [Ensifer sp. LC13]OCP13383.1 heme biosynthesis protein HemY [Ensifer sp. LC11]OCP34213.1 heme biosynthesis protein HemY [Ensifer sp. LC499]
MIRILVFILLVLGLGLGFAWLADRPGELSLVWQGQLVEMSLMRAASLLISLIAAVLIAVWLVRTIWLSPHTVTRYFRARKRDRGYQALSTGLIAAGAGDANLARKMTARTRGLISADQEPLIHLLEAQTALIEGKYDDARRKFELMADDPETRELGLRGLYLEAKRLGAHEAARQYAERAAEKAPHLPWAALATLDSQSQAGQWDDALRLLDQSRAAHVVERKDADRKKAVLLTARAMTKLDGDVKAARDDALAALKLDEHLVPAALIAAKALFREDNLRKGTAILEKSWKHEPHPDVAKLYVRARGGDTAVDRLKRARKLEALRPNNAVAMATVAETALEARELLLARTKAEAAARLDPTESVFLLLADIEEADTGDEGRIRHWMAQALRSPRDPAWTADGVTSPTWLPVSPVSGRLDAFEWKASPHTLSATVDHDQSTADEAIRSLPPVAIEPHVHEPAPVAKRKETPVILEAEREEPVVQVQPIKVAERKPPEPVAEKAAIKTTAKEDVANGEQISDPFFGRPPDDPGVRDPATGEKTPEKAGFRLF